MLYGDKYSKCLSTHQQKPHERNHLRYLNGDRHSDLILTVIFHLLEPQSDFQFKQSDDGQGGCTGASQKIRIRLFQFVIYEKLKKMKNNLMSFIQ